MDGRIVPAADAVLSVQTEAVQRGASVFEGIRIYQGSDGELRLFRLDDHLERLFETSLRFMRMRLAYGRQDLTDAVLELIEANGIAADAYVRIQAYVGEPLAYGEFARLMQYFSLCNNVSFQAGVKQVRAGIKVQPQVATCNHVKKWSCP